MSSRIPYVDLPCERCGSKKRISRTWKEEIPTFAGKKTVVEYSQIICTNVVCQAEFDENLRKEEKKKAVIRREKEKRDKERKANAKHFAKRAKIKKKNRSRI